MRMVPRDPSLSRARIRPLAGALVGAAFAMANAACSSNDAPATGSMAGAGGASSTTGPSATASTASAGGSGVTSSSAAAGNGGDGGGTSGATGGAGAGGSGTGGAGGSAFCTNGQATGTCAQTFFAPVADCFHPSGACTDDSSKGELCWVNGATTTIDTATYPYAVTWSAAGTTCMAGTQTVNPVVYTLNAHGETLVLAVNGDVTCPDGSQVNIGPLYGCTDIYLLFNPPNADACPQGSCP